MRDVKRYHDFQFLGQLDTMRASEALISYEVRLHTKGPNGMDEVYREIFERAFRHKVDKNEYLMRDDWLYCTQYLSSYFFEAQLRATLKERFGEEWFSDPRAGRFLKELWSTGGKYDVEEVVKRLGYSGLDPKPLIEEIKNYFLLAESHTY